MSNKSMIDRLDELKLAYLEHMKHCEIAAEINVNFQKNGKPDDMRLGESIITYALNRLLEDSKFPPSDPVRGGE